MRFPRLCWLLLAAFGASAAELIWNPSNIPEVSQYLIYSSTNNGPFRFLTFNSTTNYPLGNIQPQVYAFYVTGLLPAGGETAPCTNLSLVVLPCQNPTNQPPLPPPLPSTVYVELEQAVLAAPMAVTADVTASGGLAVQSMTPFAGTVTVTTTLAAGSYTVWVRARATDTGHDSYFLAVDNTPEDIAGNEASLSPDYKWRKANGGNGGPIRSFTLPAGLHTFRLRCREAPVPMDRLCVTRDGALVPQ